MIINKKRDKHYNVIILEVKLGEILQTNEYKCLEEIYNERRNHSTSIEEKKEMIILTKIRYMGLDIGHVTGTKKKI